MKISEKQLKKIITEETEKFLSEQDRNMPSKVKTSGGVGDFLKGTVGKMFNSKERKIKEIEDQAKRIRSNMLAGANDDATRKRVDDRMRDINRRISNAKKSSYRAKKKAEEVAKKRERGQEITAKDILMIIQSFSQANVPQPVINNYVGNIAGRDVVGQAAEAAASSQDEKVKSAAEEVSKVTEKMPEAPPAKEVTGEVAAGADLIRKETPPEYVNSSFFKNDSKVKKERSKYGKELAKQKAKAGMVPVFNFGYDDDGDPLKSPSSERPDPYLPGGIYHEIVFNIKDPEARRQIALNVANTLKGYGMKIGESKLAEITDEEIQKLIEEKNSRKEEHNG